MDKPLEGAVAFVDSDAFGGLNGHEEKKKLEDAGAIVVLIKPGSRAQIIWPPLVVTTKETL